MPWIKFKEKVERKFCPPNEKDKITTLILKHKIIETECREYTSLIEIGSYGTNFGLARVSIYFPIYLRISFGNPRFDGNF